LRHPLHRWINPMKIFYKMLLVLMFSQQSMLVANPSEETEPAKILSVYLKKLQSYEANFQQHIVSSTKRLLDSSSGRFLMKRPDRFRWQINKPYEQVILADGKNIWSIDMDLEQVTVTDVEKNLVNSPIMLLSGQDNRFDDYFIVEQVESETELEQFLLTPVDNSSNFEKVQLGFKDGILNLIKLHDSLGQVTLITMTNVRQNPIIGEDFFRYKEYPGFDLIDSREQGSKGG